MLVAIEPLLAERPSLVIVEARITPGTCSLFRTIELRRRTFRRKTKPMISNGASTNPITSATCPLMNG